MSLSNCPKCWDTPCTCGYGYLDMTIEDLEKLKAAINLAIEYKKVNNAMTFDHYEEIKKEGIKR
jgi:hypothetical protein